MDRATSTDPAADPSVPSEAARKRAAIELIRGHERTLKRTARRYSLCADDADDAYQRALEILLTKAPTADGRDLIRWMQTVTKHEALAVRRHRERILGSPDAAHSERDGSPDWVQLIPSERPGPADLTQRRERIARSREALKALKRNELRALTLLAEGYSYAEIGEVTGWSYTKINRLLAEGRGRFREMIARSEGGERCKELSDQLSLFCDGELGEEEAAALREHLRACGGCRSTLRAFRAAPPAAAALAPVGFAPTLVDRAQEGIASIQLRLPFGGGSPETATQVAASGGARGAGLAVTAKIIAACVGTAGGAAACVAAGVIPAPELPTRQQPPGIERAAADSAREELADAPAPGSEESAPAAPEPQPPPAQPEPAPSPAPEPEPAPPPAPAVEFSPEAAAPATTTAAPTSGAAAASSGGGSTGGSAGAAEFGP